MSEAPKQEGHVTATVAAEILGVSRQRVNQLLKAGRIASAFRMECNGSRTMWCIPRSELDNIINRRRKP